MKTVSYEESLRLKNPLYLDVRSPGEYAEDHIPGSLNLPVFDDQERSEIGKIYRLVGREEAVIRGSEIVGARLGDIVARIRSLAGRDVVVTCYRGGMRSASLVSLLGSLGFSLYQLEGGYKSYRRAVNAFLEKPPPLPPMFILEGLTGTGKTGILQRLPHAVDLEGMAGHRSSVFGALGMKPRGQKMFESFVVKRLGELQGAPFLVLEGEGRKIGNCHLPLFLVRLIQTAPALLIEAEWERRVDIILRDYGGPWETGQIVAILRSLEGRLGPRNAARMEALFLQGDLREFISLLLEKYYDPLYRHSLKKRNFLAVIEIGRASCRERV